MGVGGVVHGFSCHSACHADGADRSVEWASTSAYSSFRRSVSSTCVRPVASDFISGGERCVKDIVDASERGGSLREPSSRVCHVELHARASVGHVSGDVAGVEQSNSHRGDGALAVRACQRPASACRAALGDHGQAAACDVVSPTPPSGRHRTSSAASAGTAVDAETRSTRPS